jgi:hypothetical protein
VARLYETNDDCVYNDSEEKLSSEVLDDGISPDGSGGGDMAVDSNGAVRVFGNGTPEVDRPGVETEVGGESTRDPDVVGIVSSSLVRLSRLTSGVREEPTIVARRSTLANVGSVGLVDMSTACSEVIGTEAIKLTATPCKATELKATKLKETAELKAIDVDVILLEVAAAIEPDVTGTLEAIIK